MKTISSLVALLSLIILNQVTALPVAEAEAEAAPLDAAPVFARQLGSATTQNDILNNKPCKPVTILFARGTTEAGNVGSLTGPPFFSAVASAIGSTNLAVQGVDYPADVAGFLAGGSASGSTTFANLITQTYSQCPNTKVVISGYSQGSQLVHNAAAKLSSADAAKISAAVVFGDPDKGQAVGQVAASNVKTVCHFGDNICAGGSLVLAPHLTYAKDASDAAAFVKTQTGF